MPMDVSTYQDMPELVLVAKASAPRDLVYELTRAVMENFEIFRRLHPALEPLRRDDLVPRETSAPVHPGAQQYFEEDHPGVTALFLTGCGGDQNPYPRSMLRFSQKHGRTLATMAARARVASTAASCSSSASEVAVAEDPMEPL